MEILSPDSKSNLEQEMENYRERLGRYVGQIRHILNDKEKSLATKSVLEEQMQKVKGEYEQKKIQFTTHRREIDTFMNSRNNLESDGFQFESKSKKMLLDIHLFKSKLTNVTGEYQQEREKALSYCTEISGTRNSEEIEKEIKSLDRHL